MKQNKINLPELWKLKKLGDVCDFQNGFAFKSQLFRENGIPVIRITNIQDQSIDLNKIVYVNLEDYKQDLSIYRVQQGDLLIAMSGATTGKIGVVDNGQEFLLNQRVGKFIPKQILNKKYLYYYLLTQEKESLKISAGSAQPNLSTQQIKSFKIPVPPIEEQKRIVEILDKAFEGIAQAEANTRRNLTNARELFDSYLNSALIGFVLQETPQILADITELIIDCEHKTAPTQEMGYPSIRTPNIGKGYLTLDNVYRVSEETYQEWTRRAKPQANDLILAREAPAGNVGIVPEGEKVCLGQRTVLIRPKKTINSQYLAFYLLHPEMQKQLLSKSSGATVQHVNMKDIRSLKISYFPSMEVQQKLAEALQSIQSRSKQLETIYQRKLEAIAELKQSILEKAFTGQLSQ